MFDRHVDDDIETYGHALAHTYILDTYQREDEIIDYDNAINKVLYQ